MSLDVGDERKIPSVVDKETFLERFHIFTNDQLRGWTDWSNMIVTGSPLSNTRTHTHQVELFLHPSFLSPKM